ncbi:diacylglycerol/lipid kinase family protein [Marinovum sp.]|uniref:diacylglycerol/lipid kinase family protein n=1 Tax=Marinovum sp. TaxID=2024839 RepID=UPI002B26698C|nr:diacylglycerol kinase family protein [Marinovum sp.]
MRACIILNPASGRGDHRGDEVRAAAAKYPEVEIREIPSPKKLSETVEKALADGCDPIIAAGGDGTIGALASALAGTGVTLGILPMGTFNYFARSLDLPQDPAEALEIALNGASRQVPIGDVNGRIFLNNASLGAYASVLSVREHVYRNWGRSRLAAYWSVIVAMTTIYQSLKMKITVDGETHQLKSPMAFVAISAYQLDEFDLDGAEAIKQGKLALFVARDVGRLQLLWRALRIFFRGARSGTDYVLLTGADITIETRRNKRLIAHDGEKERMPGPYRFRLRQGALTVRVPQDAEQAA